MQALGIDIGGTGIKGAPVDLASGKLLADRKKIATPHPVHARGGRGGGAGSREVVRLDRALSASPSPAS